MSRHYACDGYKTDANSIVVVVVETPQKDASDLKHIERINQYTTSLFSQSSCLKDQNHDTTGNYSEDCSLHTAMIH